MSRPGRRSIRIAPLALHITLLAACLRCHQEEEAREAFLEYHKALE